VVRDFTLHSQITQVKSRRQSVDHNGIISFLKRAVSISYTVRVPL
jgi:hypothetical protein